MDERRLAQEQGVLLARLEAAKSELLKFPNTLAVGIGIKESGNRFTEEISYRVFVREKKGREELRPDEIIPPEIGGIRTDVLPPYRIKDRPEVCGTEIETLSKHRPLQAGVAISTDSVTYGTLGWFGTLDADDTPILLTNKHVLYDSASEVTTTKKATAQPQLGNPSKCCCCECGSDNVIGEALIGIRDFTPMTATSVDCAIARIDSDHGDDISFVITNDATAEVLSVSGTAAAVVGESVRKIGARSGFTRGIVVHLGDVAAEGTDPEGDPIAIRPGQVLVIPDPAETYQVDDRGTCKFAFSNNGDSGSVILNSSDEIVALLYGGDERPNSVDVTFANNIANVLTALNDNASAITLSTDGGGDRRGLHHHVPVLARERPMRPVEPNVFETLRDANSKSLLSELYDRHHRELLTLVNQRRPVTVVWQRNQGPAFVAALARAARVEHYVVPHEVEGTGREALLRAMVAVLRAHGSPRLLEDLARYGADLLAVLTEEETVEGIAVRLHELSFLDALPARFMSARR